MNKLIFFTAKATSTLNKVNGTIAISSKILPSNTISPSGLEFNIPIQNTSTPIKGNNFFKLNSKPVTKYVPSAVNTVKKRELNN